MATGVVPLPLAALASCGVAGWLAGPAEGSGRCSGCVPACPHAPPTDRPTRARPGLAMVVAPAAAVAWLVPTADGRDYGASLRASCPRPLLACLLGNAKQHLPWRMDGRGAPAQQVHVVPALPSYSRRCRTTTTTTTTVLMMPMMKISGGRADGPTGLHLDDTTSTITAAEKHCVYCY